MAMKSTTKFTAYVFITRTANVPSEATYTRPLVLGLWRKETTHPRTVCACNTITFISRSIREGFQGNAWGFVSLYYTKPQFASSLREHALYISYIEGLVVEVPTLVSVLIKAWCTLAYDQHSTQAATRGLQSSQNRTEKTRLMETTDDKFCVARVVIPSR